MGDFRILTDDELVALSSKERREYQRSLKEYNNKKMVLDIVNQENEVTEAPKEESSMSEVVVVKEESPAAEVEENRIEKATTTENLGQQKIIDFLNLNAGKPERMTVQKSFLITPSLNNKFSELAKQKDMSENALFNLILKRVLE